MTRASRYHINRCDGCDKKKRILAGGLCSACYNANRRGTRVVERQSTLIQTPVEPPSIDYAGCVCELKRKGFSIAGEIHVPKANPAGRRILRVAYTRRDNWSDAHELSALRVAVHWFVLIGGFATIRNRQLCHVVARLREGSGEKWLHAAIEAYAASEWHRAVKGRFKKMSDFYCGDDYEKWLEESQEYQLEIARRHADQLQQERAAMRKQNAKLPPVHELDDDTLRAYFLADQRDEEARRQAEQEARDKALKGCPPAVLNRFRRQVSRQWDHGDDWRKCRAWFEQTRSRAPGTANTFDESVATLAMGWAARKHHCHRDDLIAPVERTQPYRLTERPKLRHEVLRRSLAEVPWLAVVPPWTGLNTDHIDDDDKAMAKDLRDALIELRIQAWLDNKPFTHTAEEERYRRFSESLMSKKICLTRFNHPPTLRPTGGTKWPTSI